MDSLIIRNIGENYLHHCNYLIKYVFTGCYIGIPSSLNRYVLKIVEITFILILTACWKRKMFLQINLNKSIVLLHYAVS